MAAEAHYTNHVSVWSEEQLHAVARRLYTPIRKWQTRILRLHPGQRHDVLEADILPAGITTDNGLVLGMDEEPVPYEAISYSWGTRSACIEIWINGMEYRLHQALADALRQFRRNKSERYLWADALCIDQADLVEKSQQVLNMFRIFRKAKCVLVWLGKETKNSTVAATLLRSGMVAELSESGAEASRTGRAMASDGNTLRRDILALRDLCCRGWVRRVWIQQEIFAARRLRVFCGSWEISLEAYKSAASALSRMLDDEENSLSFSREEVKIIEWSLEAASNLRSAGDLEILEIQMQRDTPLPGHEDVGSDSEAPDVDDRQEKDAAERADLRDRANRPDTRGYDKQADALFESVLRRSQSLEATDPRDYVYALLSLTDCPLARSPAKRSPFKMHIDYNKTVSQVYQDATKYIMNRDYSYSILRNVHRSGVSRAGVEVKLPSWTFDWSKTGAENTARPAEEDWRKPYYHEQAGRTRLFFVGDIWTRANVLDRRGRVLGYEIQDYDDHKYLTMKALLFGIVESIDVDRSKGVRTVHTMSHIHTTTGAGSNTYWSAEQHRGSVTEPLTPDGQRSIPIEVGDWLVQCSSPRDPFYFRPCEDDSADGFEGTFLGVDELATTLSRFLHRPWPVSGHRKKAASYAKEAGTWRYTYDQMDNAWYADSVTLLVR